MEQPDPIPAADETEPVYTAETWPHQNKYQPKKATQERKHKAREEKRKSRRKPCYKASWKDLPATASPKVEANWVHANWRRVKEVQVKEGVKTIRINYAKLKTDPPSEGALSMLEIAVENSREFEGKTWPGLVKNVVDVHDLERRDRMQVNEIAAILKQFDEAGNP